MKTKLSIGLLTAAAVIGFISCEKENRLNPKDSSNSNNNMRLHDDLENPDDAADEDMNDNLFMMASAFKSITLNSTTMEDLYDAVDANADFEVKYSELVTSNSAFESVLNENLREEFFPEEPSTYDALGAIDEAMEYNDVNYYPAIYVPNWNTATTTVTPIIGIGADAGENDEILVFVYTTSGWTEDHMTEAEVAASDAPVIIFNAGTDEVDQSTDGTSITKNTGNVTPQGASRKYEWDDYKINNGYRYESGLFNNNKSDMDYLFSIFDDQGNLHSPSQGQFGGGAISSSIDKISKSDVQSSTQFTSNKPLTLVNIDTTLVAQYPYAYCTVYEHDWYATKKKVSSCQTALLWHHRMRMKYQGEWYINIICDTDQIADLDMLNANLEFGTAKATVRIVRTQ